MSRLLCAALAISTVTRILPSLWTLDARFRRLLCLVSRATQYRYQQDLYRDGPRWTENTRLALAGRFAMNTLRQAVRDYLEMRRSLGFKLHAAGKLLIKFVTFMERHRASYVTSQLAL